MCQTTLHAHGLLGDVYNIPIKQVKTVLLAFTTISLYCSEYWKYREDVTHAMNVISCILVVKNIIVWVALSSNSVVSGPRVSLWSYLFGLIKVTLDSGFEDVYTL